MRKLLPLILLLTGCSPEIQCWYATGYTQLIGEPWFVLHGRTTTMMNDVRGPMFKSQQEMELYLANHNLKMCGTK